MKYHEMTKNYIFREFECGLSIDETAELCFKSVRTIKGWDEGKPIPKECKRLMRFYTKLELSNIKSWQGFKMSGGHLLLPNGQKVTPQQIVTGICLLEIQSELELKTTTKLLKFVRALTKIKASSSM